MMKVKHFPARRRYQSGHVHPAWSYEDAGDRRKTLRPWEMGGVKQASASAGNSPFAPGNVGKSRNRERKELVFYAMGTNVAKQKTIVREQGKNALGDNIIWEEFSPLLKN
ncbi:hypothetical protein DL771_001285 [Monosporascus sp. 5C6A]|nr:hypothetical protein DL771_001285 [Monosporascus sp. 5C6A]